MPAGLELPLATLAFLLGAAFVAGWVDAVVGGGGLIQLPALLIGLPGSTPVPTIAGTNKLAAAVGTASAAATYLRSVPVRGAAVIPLVACSALGSALGAQLTHLLDRRQFTPIVLVVVLVVGTYTWRRPELGLTAQVRHHGGAAQVRLAGIGLLVGIWDGFIGPGTGTFFLLLLVAVLGMEFLAATTLAKLANLTTNVAAIAVFASTGHVWWSVALLMAAGNLAGGLLGSRRAVRGGNAFVRRVFLVVVGALALKLTWDTVAMLG